MLTYFSNLFSPSYRSRPRKNFRRDEAQRVAEVRAKKKKKKKKKKEKRLITFLF